MTSAEVRDVIEWARRLDCRVALARSGHYRVTYRGRLVGTIAATPSDRRTPLNDKAFIRRNLAKLRQGAGRATNRPTTKGTT